MGHNSTSTVVGDYGNTTNDGMQTTICAKGGVMVVMVVSLKVLVVDR